MENKMPDNQATNLIVEELEDEEDEYCSDDFGFIVGPDGELKSMMIPEHLMEDPPEEIKQILQVFGIQDIFSIGQRTIH